MRGGSRTKNFHLSFAIRLLNKSLSTDSGVKTTKATLLEAVKQRFNGIYTEPLYFLATILDPRYKDRFFDQATKQQATEMLLRKLNKMTEPENSTENERNETEPPLKKTCTETYQNQNQLVLYSHIRTSAFNYFVNHTTLDIQRTFASKYAIKTILGHFDRW